MGDMHVHSRRSDGKEAPDIVAANYRKAGFDFFALTDHELYEPSLEAINAYKDAPIDFKLFPGEEVHPPENRTHYIHFGGKYSINGLIRSDPDKYRAEVKQLAETLDPGEGIDRKEYASAAWVSREIHKAGGLAVMVHPHWVDDNSYHIGEKMAVCMLKSKLFDAFEVIGGQTLLENQPQVSLWQDMRAEGCFVPPMGNSDSHGTVNGEWFEIAKTVVLAESCEYDALKEAIIAGCSVALEEYKGEDFPHLYGLHRYVSFVQFLLEDYFPIHDELCVEEGRLMKEYVTGDAASASSVLKGLQGRCAALQKKYWGK
jgi:predicted metal-dependent phosphoesterase TrpH